MVLPAFMQRGKAQYMTSGSLIPRREVDLETGHSLCEDWTTEIIYLSAKTNKTPGPAMYKNVHFTQVGLGKILLKCHLQRWAIGWALGCVNPASSWLPLAAGREFTQPRAHSFAPPHRENLAFAACLQSLPRVCRVFSRLVG